MNASFKQFWDAQEVRRFTAIMRREWQLTIRDPFVIFLVLATPVILLLLLGKPLGGLFLRYMAHPGQQGTYAALAPRAAMMFAFFGVGIVTVAFFRERWLGYGELFESWPVRRGTVIAAKLAVPWLMIVLQFILLTTVATLLDGGIGYLHLPVVAVSAVVTATWVTALGAATLSITTTASQSTQVSNLIVMLGGIGAGLLVPVLSLSEPLQVIAHVFPQYWMNRAFMLGDEHPGVGQWILIDAILLVVAALILFWVSRRLSFRRFRTI